MTDTRLHLIGFGNLDIKILACYSLSSYISLLCPGGNISGQCCLHAISFQWDRAR
jgi:hypothetical protein